METPVIFQQALETQLHNLFPHCVIRRNSRKDTTLSSPATGNYLEVDLWLPGLDLCFEFQDEHHYKTTWYAHRQLDLVRHIDDSKRIQLNKKKLTYIAIPYWWDGTSKSLHGTIAFHRPDLAAQHMQNMSEISANPMTSVFDDEFLHLMLASFISTNEIELLHNSVWWVGEKWDGIRCFWNSPKNQLYSRQNMPLNLPLAQTNNLSNVICDGELWCGRNSFVEAVKTVNDPSSLNTSFIKVVCFDEASLQSQRSTFEIRYALLLSHLPSDHTSIILAPRFRSDNESVLLNAMLHIIEEGGEGLILRSPLSRYLGGRTKSLLKLKANRDQEALVLSVGEDGALLLQLVNGATLVIAGRDCLLPSRPVKGDVVSISVSHQGGQSLKDLLSTTSNPVVTRIRSDLSWQDVSYAKGSESYEPNKVFFQNRLNTPELYKQKPSHKGSPNETQKLPTHSWQRVSERRAYFDKFAELKGADALNPEFWYSVTLNDLTQYHSGYFAIVEYHYKGQLSNAIMQLYPNIGLQLERFRKVQSWRFESNRKAYFDKFAKLKGGDPLNPEFWYSVTSHNFGYAHIVKQYYGGKLSKAVMQLFPNIGLQLSRFRKAQPWSSASNRKAYFDKFAALKGADALNAEFWYTVTPRDLKRYNTAYSSIVKKYYGGKLSTAITHLYPNIDFQVAQFKKAQPWMIESNRKAYFDKFAKSKGADALNPEFWYDITLQELTQFHSGCATIIKYYGGNLIKAIVQLYPNIGLQLSRFRNSKKARMLAET